MEDEVQSEDHVASESEESSSRHAADANGVRDVFYSGERMDADEALGITRSSLARVIILAGPPRSGKTTILTSIHHLLQRDGSIGEFRFASSKTLIGLERISHTARLRSGRTNPETERTKSANKIEFLHLCVQNKISQEKIHMLVSNVPGETFERARKRSDEAQRLKALRRTDQLNILLDGEQIIQPKKRHTVLTKARTLIGRLVEDQVVGNKTNINILFTKCDLIELEDDRVGIKKFIKMAKNSLHDKYDNKFNQMRFFKVSARPKTESPFDLGHGVKKVFKEWVNEPPRARKKDAEKCLFDKTGRQFERYRSYDCHTKQTNE